MYFLIMFPFVWDCPKEELGSSGWGMILFKLIEMKLYRFLSPCVCEHVPYQA